MTSPLLQNQAQVRCSECSATIRLNQPGAFETRTGHLLRLRCGCGHVDWYTESELGAESAASTLDSGYGMPSVQPALAMRHEDALPAGARVWAYDFLLENSARGSDD